MKITAVVRVTRLRNRGISAILVHIHEEFNLFRVLYLDIPRVINILNYFVNVSRIFIPINTYFEMISQELFFNKSVFP